ncbi:MAG: ATP-binding protein [Actinomycetota bacterium]|nr:ATP-binding protein [Actinomycetota bacterium]
MAIEPSVIEEIRLANFKSFRDAVLPLDAFTLLVGRNGSGKSNALDGLWTLARLASGEDIRDALDGGREGPAVRGGVIGCAPFGESTFSLGCSVRTERALVRLDVTVQVEPVVQVLKEKLAIGSEVVLKTDPASGDSADIVASWSNQQPGRNPKEKFRASRLLTTQVLSRIPATEPGQRIHIAAAQVLEALRSVFVLDPVPHLMRQYVPRRDMLLRRNADNLSAAVASLIETGSTKDLLRTALMNLNEQQIDDITMSSSELDDVMLTLSERQDGRKYPVPARLMSDGSLRFLAILVALLQAPNTESMPDPLASGDAVGQTTLVIEELENGLHASQAGTLIGLIRDQVRTRRVRALATAHSPALLDALTGSEHRTVIVCERDSNGHSTLSRLVDLPGYMNVVAGGGLGKAAIDDKLRATTEARPAREFLDDILGPR